MRFTCTDGSTRELPDMCACCQMDTGGNHQVGCPLSFNSHTIREAQIPQPFVYIFIRCPWCDQDMRFDGYREQTS